MAFRVGCDIGGTFTDFVLLDDATGEIVVGKDLTTPADPSVGVLGGLRALDGARPRYAAATSVLAHATTLVANTVIERKGARTALLATRRFRDVLELRRHVRVTTYELWADPPEPLVPRRLRLSVTERTAADGRIVTPVDPEEIAQIAKVLRGTGVESVAIAVLHSYANPANETTAARLLGDLLPDVAVTASSAVLPQIKEFARGGTSARGAIDARGGASVRSGDSARSVATPKNERPAFSPRRGSMIPFAVYDRLRLAPGMKLAGPAVVEEASATTVVDAGGALEVDRHGSLVVTVAS